jgi:hypothetical protein
VGVLLIYLGLIFETEKDQSFPAIVTANVIIACFGPLLVRGEVWDNLDGSEGHMALLYGKIRTANSETICNFHGDQDA